MSAITGRYDAPTKQWRNNAAAWLRRRGPEWRDVLAGQLRTLRKRHSAHEAREFGNYLLWLGVYPSKYRLPGGYHDLA